MHPRILILKAGAADPALSRALGDHEDWFRSLFDDGLERCDVVSAFLGETLPRPVDYGGVLITGASASVRDEAPWMSGLARWALAAADAGVPVLGVCFGHQLLGEALGGRVGRNPAGGEHGTIRVALTEAGRADPLFEGIVEPLAVQSTHNDALVSEPTDWGAVCLAGNRHTTWQAFAAGPNVRGVQFHPEMSAEVLRQILVDDGLGGEVQATSDGAKILNNWDRHWVRRR